jgi:hypothetical protein
MLHAELSTHAKEMLVERRIAREWVQRCLEAPDRRELGSDGNIHYFRAIE